MAKTSTVDKTKESDNESNVCFVAMPIRSGVEYEHFKKVYDQIFVPAIEMAGFVPRRADDTASTHVIQIKVLLDVINSPLVLCDLSRHNPNVLYELGIRQAFDRPVVLVQEEGTEGIFDVSPLKYNEYRSARLYDEVLRDREIIAQAITSTMKLAKEEPGMNSLVGHLAVQAATIANATADERAIIDLIQTEFASMRRMISGSSHRTDPHGKLRMQYATLSEYMESLAIRGVERWLSRTFGLPSFIAQAYARNSVTPLDFFSQLVEAVDGDAKAVLRDMYTKIPQFQLTLQDYIQQERQRLHVAPIRTEDGSIILTRTKDE